MNGSRRAHTAPDFKPNDRKFSMSEQKFKLAAIQASSVWLDRDATVAKACALIEEAGTAGADLVGFPENFIPGHPSWYYFRPANDAASVASALRLFQESVEIPSPSTDALCRAAARAEINVVIGLTEKIKGTNGTLYNTQLFIDSSGNIIGKHQKLVPTITERMVHAPGTAATQRTFPSNIGNLSGLLCAENLNPLAIAMVAASYPVAHVASWPNNFTETSGNMRENSMLVSRNVAYTLGSFVISSCGVNSEEMVVALATNEQEADFLRDPVNNGGSCIISPSGKVIAGPMAGDQEGIIYADIDIAACTQAKLGRDFAGHYNRSDVYRLLVNNEDSELVSVTSSADGSFHGFGDRTDFASERNRILDDGADHSSWLIDR
jgi:nitrilase